MIGCGIATFPQQYHQSYVEVRKGTFVGAMMLQT